MSPIKVPYDVLLGILERRFGKVITLNTKSRLLS